MTKLRSGAEPPEFEEGQQTLTIDRIEVDEENDYMGESRPQAIWIFTAADGDTQMRGYTSLSYFEGSQQYSPSKLYQWLKVLKSAPTGENEFDFDSLQGAVVSAIVGSNKKGWPKVEKLVKLVSASAKRLDQVTAESGVKSDWAEDANATSAEQAVLDGFPVN